VYTRNSVFKINERQFLWSHHIFHLGIQQPATVRHS
jgi:hypothetical protein